MNQVSTFAGSAASSVAASSAPVVRALNTPRPMIPQVAPGVSPVVAQRRRGGQDLGDERRMVSGLAQSAYRRRNAGGADARTLQLYAEGIEQPLLILGRQSGSLGPNDSIEFYGTGIDTPFSGTRVYWLVRGSHAGKRISSISAAGKGAASDASFPFTVLFEQRTTYFAGLLNGINNDNFFGAIVSTDPVDQPIAVAHVDPASSLPVTLNVTLQGVTDQQSAQRFSCVQRSSGR